MRRFLTAVFLLATTPALAQPEVLSFGHNGSVMDYVIDGSNRTIVYNRPRPSIAAIGVSPGTILFQGVKQPDGRLVGTGFVFSWECGATPYELVSTFASGELILLEGAAPILDAATCAQIGATYESPNAHLYFQRLR